MLSSIPDEWKCSPPESLVVGNGSYAVVLATILGTSLLSLDQLRGSPQPTFDGSYHRVLGKLQRVILVVSEAMSAADALRCHHSFWNWVCALSSTKNQHDLAFVFVLPPSAGKSYEEALAAGLDLPKLDPETTGHAVWNRFGSLSGLIAIIEHIEPEDLLWLRAQQAADGKRRALAQLLSLPDNSAPVKVQEFAVRVLELFRDKEYLFDVFCRPPSHPNGNELRKWLRMAVTGPVTQDWWEGTRRNLDQWLNVEGL